MKNYQIVMNARSAQVLKAVVEMYIAQSEPVGARAISKKYDFSLSPATIRNVMADLEEEGYLSQPHTSAGRVPSDSGYRLYAQALVSHETLPLKEKKNICDAAYCPELREIAIMFSSITRTLANISHQAGLAGLSSWAATPMKKMRFVNMENRLALAVMVTTGGEMQSQLITLKKPMDQNALDKLTNFFNDRFSGKTLFQIRKALMDEIARDKNHINILSAQALFMAEEIEEKVTTDLNETIYIGGTSNLLAQRPGVIDISKMKALFKTLDEKSKLVDLLNSCIHSDGINLIIGSESNVTELNDYSLVTQAFTGEGGAMGAVGVIGLKQMNYGHVMALVAYTARQISRRLAGENVEFVN